VNIIFQKDPARNELENERNNNKRKIAVLTMSLKELTKNLCRDIIL